jgi:hypothetical protein
MLVAGSDDKVERRGKKWGEIRVNKLWLDRMKRHGFLTNPNCLRTVQRRTIEYLRN